MRRIELDASKEWQIGYQEEATPIMSSLRDFHDKLVYYLIIIMAIIGYIVWREIIGKNLGMKYKNHSTIIEIIWTIIPGIILVIIAIPSIKILYATESEDGKSELTMKVSGNQWYWNYHIVESDIKIDSYTKSLESLNKGELRLLEVDNRVKLPIDKGIRLFISAEDVIHSFAVPSLGIKIDAIPGRINKGYIRIIREGVYYGQCSELCGQSHYNMSIVIEALKDKDYLSWVLSNSNISLNNLRLFVNFINSHIPLCE